MHRYGTRSKTRIPDLCSHRFEKPSSAVQTSRTKHQIETIRSAHTVYPLLSPESVWSCGPPKTHMPLTKCSTPLHSYKEMQPCVTDNTDFVKQTRTFSFADAKKMPVEQSVWKKIVSTSSVSPWTLITALATAFAVFLGIFHNVLTWEQVLHFVLGAHTKTV